MVTPARQGLLILGLAGLQTRAVNSEWVNYTVYHTNQANYSAGDIADSTGLQTKMLATYGASILTRRSPDLRRHGTPYVVRRPAVFFGLIRGRCPPWTLKTVQ